WRTKARGACAETRRGWTGFSNAGAWSPSPPGRATICGGSSARPTGGGSCSTSGTRAATPGGTSFSRGPASSASPQKG
ncbi:MAG: hypothetical protein AVDCRST_MAG01-01-1723, partial [uncultured Rubrobacteraceae bacterium]